MNKEQELEFLLNEFDRHPKIVHHPTYLELCQYPYRRFEEIASRLLSFYFKPTREHGLKDLFIKSLLQTINLDSQLEYREEQVKILMEDNAEGKRIDIVILGDNFVIGIENKIYASLYNPLDSYQKRLQSYHKKHTIGIVLSLNKIQQLNEISKMQEHGFINVLYSDVFTSVKQNIGFYLNNSSDKYFIYLKDFITTFENMEDNNLLDEPLSGFFLNNSEKVDELIKLYNDFNNRVVQKQNEFISLLGEKISERTKQTWNIWGGFDLFCKFNINDHELGIETHFKKTKSSPVGQFNILITTWNLNDWEFFRDSILAIFPGIPVEINKDKRAIATYKSLIDADEDQILNELQYVYNEVKNKIESSTI